MNDRHVFVDSNILVYVFDKGSPDKADKARKAVRKLWEENSGCVSIQVLQEFYSVTTRKLANRLSSQETRSILKEYAAWPVYSSDTADVIFASHIEEKYDLSFWDAMIIVAARRLGADELLSEDMQHGQTIEGVLITNPFLT